MKLVGLIIGLGLAGAAVAQPAGERPGFRDTPKLPDSGWRVHDADRPYPPVVTPGAVPGAAPSDAVILFDGRSLDAWTSPHGPWELKDGVMTVPPRKVRGQENPLISRQSFGDVQMHLEFRTPNPPQFSGQDRGNSGIWFMQRYEVQILDGWNNPTYADGMIGSVYAWKPPLVNASRPPGEWQSYDIIFERPRFTADGKVEQPAHVTVFLNGVLVQHRTPMLGTTVWKRVAQYSAHGDSAPIQLQDHDQPVSFRNIWVRPLSENPRPEPQQPEKPQ